jgi:hypothetical protein
MTEPASNLPATVITKRVGVERESAVARTGKTMPDVVLKAMHPIAIVFVRAARVYLQTFLGIATALQSGFAHKVGIDFDTHDLSGVIGRAAAIAIAPVFFTVLQNVIELLAKVDEKVPELRA